MAQRRCIGILREVKNKWERRAPLDPKTVGSLVQRGVQVLVQPSNRRVFTNEEYADAGAIITEDISAANTIFGVKEIPPKNVLPGKTYVLFAHVIKAQPSGMPLLDEFLKKNARLVDYEVIRNVQAKGGQRLVAFGKFAGLAGMIDGLRGLGERLLSYGFSTPFLGLANSFMYPDLETAKKAVTAVGNEIARVGLPKDMAPLTFAFTGDGNVAKGAQEIWNLLPHDTVLSDRLPSAVEDAKSRLQYKLINIPVHHPDIVAPNDSSLTSLDWNHYLKQPNMYRPVFHQRIAPYASVIVNGMYWDKRYPRLLTLSQLRALKSQLPLGFLGAFDISCDVEGALEFLVKSTSIDRPFFVYDPESGAVADGLDGKGVFMLGVDNLPTEFPRDASEHFSQALEPFVEALSLPEGAAPLPPELEHAVITSRGRLTPDFEYIKTMREAAAKARQVEAAPAAAEPSFRQTLLVEGHLFDSGFINKALDLVEFGTARCRLHHFELGVDRSSESQAVIEVMADKRETLEAIVAKINSLREHLPSAQARIQLLPHAASAPRGPQSGAGSPQHKNLASLLGGLPLRAAEKKVLVIGSGYVAGPVIEQLTREGRFEVVLASADVEQANKLIERVEAKLVHVRQRCRVQQLDVRKQDALEEAVRNADVVVSLLPATMHIPVARLCVQHRRHLVTASYVSEEMRALDAAARQSKVTLFNEIGLDPGLDHVSALSVIQDVKAKGGEVVGFESVCGGLPAPEAADNPLGYKFSWSPRGVLNAALNSARYLRSGRIVEIPGEKLLSSASPIDIYPAFNFEQLPNRDSLKYRDVYGLHNATTIYRGTLRYRGFCGALDAFRRWGLLSADAARRPTVGAWSDYLCTLLRCTPATLRQSMLAALGEASQSTGAKGMETAEWLGMLNGSAQVEPADSPIDAFCKLLQTRLQFGPKERDMVVLHHTFHVLPDGSATASGARRIQSTLLAYGDEQWSAMARTVGIPAALVTRAIAEGRWQKPGVHIPSDPALVELLMRELRAEGISFVERVM